MLRITVMNSPDSLGFQLEGRLAGPWVRELEHCLQKNQGLRPRPVLRFDLTGVTYIDRAGKAFLAARHAEGAQFVAAGCLMNAVVAEITSAPVPAAPLTPPPFPRRGGEGAKGAAGSAWPFPLPRGEGEDGGEGARGRPGKKTSDHVTEERT
jgi:hypothetical protein